MPQPAQTADSVNALKHFLVHYKAWILALLAPLGGIWAVVIVALIDASFFGIPLDPVIAVYVAHDPRRTLVYALMASLGSALGSSVPYLIGYKGGEALVVKKLGQQRFERLHGLSEKYGDMALIIPALMPPGFPFKAFALIARSHRDRLLTLCALRRARDGPPGETSQPREIPLVKEPTSRHHPYRRPWLSSGRHRKGRSE